MRIPLIVMADSRNVKQGPIVMLFKGKWELEGDCENYGIIFGSHSVPVIGKKIWELTEDTTFQVDLFGVSQRSVSISAQRVA